jgi:hypothetical protein
MTYMGALLAGTFVSPTHGEVGGYVNTRRDCENVFGVAGYSGTPLARKLGVAAGHALLLDGAPAGFTVEGLPEGVTVHRRAGSGRYDVIVCFCPDAVRLRRRWPALHPLTTSAGSLWIAWPKRSSGMVTDLDGNIVRDYALVNGRVDVKVCAIDEVWSGLKHVIRKADR